MYENIEKYALGNLLSVVQNMFTQPSPLQDERNFFFPKLRMKQPNTS